MYGFSDASAFLPGFRLWDCQAPATADAGLWVVVSANQILDAHNCIWIMQYPHEALAGGSMFAVQLPRTIPLAGTMGGPPPVEARRLFLGFPVEMREMFLGLCRRPEDMQKVMAEMQARFQKQMEAQKKK
jgi:hypothetical protein